MHLADAFIQSDLQSIQVIHFLSVFPHNLQLGCSRDNAFHVSLNQVLDLNQTNNLAIVFIHKM